MYTFHFARGKVTKQRHPSNFINVFQWGRVLGLRVTLIISDSNGKTQSPSLLYVRAWRARCDGRIPQYEQNPRISRRINLRIGLRVRAAIYCTTLRSIRPDLRLPRHQYSLSDLHSGMRCCG